jgi:uncharacterized protein (DUF302 family)
MKRVVAAAIVGLIALPAWAGADRIVKVRSNGDVVSTMDALEAVVKKAGATVFARVDHAAGAAKVSRELAPEQVLIFGNPKLGTPAMQDDPLAGLYLPLKVLVYQDDQGTVWLAYEKPAETLGDLNIPAEAAYVQKMTGALGKLTGIAAGG